MYTTRKVISSTWGVMPSFRDFETHVSNNLNDSDEPVIGGKHGVYWLETPPGSDDDEAVGFGLRHLAPTLISDIEYEAGDYGRGRVIFRSLRALYAFIRETSRSRRESVNSLASAIMGQLGYEWI